MPTLRPSSLLFLLFALDLCAQSPNEGTRVVEISLCTGPRFSSAEDSLAFTAFQERNMSKGASYSVPFRSRGYRLMWHMHQEDDRCTISRGDGRTVKEFKDDPPAGYPTNEVEPTAYGTRCVVIQMMARRPSRTDRWYFEEP